MWLRVNLISMSFADDDDDEYIQCIYVSFVCPIVGNIVSYGLNFMNTASAKLLTIA